MDKLIEGAKIIAKFMDYTISEVGNTTYFTNHETGEIGNIKKLVESMDQHMFVFKKIRKLGWRVVIDDDKCRVSKDGKVFKAHTCVPANSCFLCIMYFLDWYNKSSSLQGS